MFSHGEVLPMDRPRWFETARFRQTAAVLVLAFVLGEGIVAVKCRDNDFLGHYDHGERILAQGPKELPWCHYPLGRHAINGCLALLPYRLARLACYGIAVAGLFASFRMWLAMSGRTVSASVQYAAGAFTLLAAGVLVQRDLDECGLHLLLLFVLTTTAWCLWRQHPVQAGFWLGVAIIYKTTPAILVPFLLWKRQWRAACSAMIFAVGLNLAPALYFGWEPSYAYHLRFVQVAYRSATIEDPCDNVVEGPKLHNQSLNVAFARAVQTYPPGHPLYVESSLNFQPFDLSVAHARLAVKCVTLLFLAAIAWRTRRASSSPAEFASEWAAVMILPCLLSPLCWAQHLVMALPAVLLLLLDQLSPPSEPGWRRWIVPIFTALVLMLARDLVGSAWAELALSYKTGTLAVLLVLYADLTRRVAEDDAMPAVGTNRRDLFDHDDALAGAA